MIDRDKFFSDDVFSERLSKIKSLKAGVKTPVKRKLVKKKPFRNKLVKRKLVKKKMTKKVVKKKSVKRKIAKPKKKVAKRKPSTSKKRERGMIQEALADLSNEISRINSEKRRLNDQIVNADKNLKNSMEIERKLQQRIAQLAESEALLKQKKREISLKEEALADKLSRIRKIKVELDEI